MQIDHWMLFSTFAEQRHFVYPTPDTYQGVVINANMAAHAPAGLAAFLLGKTAGLSYIIDPLTHAFQHDPEVICGDEGEPRSSIKSLAEYYGKPVDKLVGTRPLLPKQLADEKVLSAFTDRCVEFQLNHLRSFMQKSDTAKYLDDKETDLPPYAVVAPYFFLTETTYPDWVPVCVHAANRTYQIVKAQSSDAATKVFGAVVVSQGILVDEAAQDRITKQLGETPMDGFLLWADNLDERSASTGELRGLLRLSRQLRGDGRREVLNIHGGYFSILAAGVLGDGAMSGVTHAPEFGEFRPVIPVGGGIPLARYYLPGLHARVRYRDALRIIREKGWLGDVSTFVGNVCNCDKCREVLQNNVANFTLFGESTVKNVRRRSGIVRIEFPTTDAKLRCLCHYLQRKRIEYQMAATATKEQIVADLDKGKQELEDVVGLEAVAHLERWKTALKA